MINKALFTPKNFLIIGVIAMLTSAAFHYAFGRHVIDQRKKARVSPGAAEPAAEMPVE